MKTTEAGDAQRMPECERLEDELGALVAHINAGIARWLDLALEFQGAGGAAIDGLERWLAFRCGTTQREAREYVRVAEALQGLTLIRDAFRRGQLTFSKVRALTRVATPASEERLLELAEALTASQLERALRTFRRIRSEEAGETHALEYVDYHWGEDGSLYLRARLPAEDGTLVVRALDAARERVRERRREERAAMAGAEAPAVEPATAFEPPRALNVEALVEAAQAALASPTEHVSQAASLVLHVDAAALTGDGEGRCALEDGPTIAAETARRLGCDAETIVHIEHEGLPLSVGRARRTVSPRLRRLLEARDDGCCRWPGCTNRRHLQAHHREHWARGGETSLDNLVLLCWQHHRLVHEGGYVLEDGPGGELHFRNRHGVLVPTIPRSPPGGVEELIDRNDRAGLTLTDRTNRNGYGDPLDLELAVAAIEHPVA
jgi:Domain of unknown function (DUF222)/HNH endonuclease